MGLCKYLNVIFCHTFNCHWFEITTAGRTLYLLLSPSDPGDRQTGMTELKILQQPTASQTLYFHVSPNSFIYSSEVGFWLSPCTLSLSRAVPETGNNKTTTEAKANRSSKDTIINWLIFHFPSKVFSFLEKRMSSRSTITRKLLCNYSKVRRVLHEDQIKGKKSTDFKPFPVCRHSVFTVSVTVTVISALY